MIKNYATLEVVKTEELHKYLPLKNTNKITIYIWNGRKFKKRIFYNSILMGKCE